MTRLASAMASVFLLAGVGLAQVRDLRYPPLAAAARVQRDARLRSAWRLCRNIRKPDQLCKKPVELWVYGIGRCRLIETMGVVTD